MRRSCCLPSHVALVFPVEGYGQPDRLPTMGFARGSQRPWINTNGFTAVYALR